MAHLFNLPTATCLLSLSTQAGMWSHQSKGKTNVGEHLDPPWEAAVSRNLPWKVPQLQNPPPMSLSKKNFWVKFQPQECPWEIRAFGHFFSQSHCKLIFQREKFHLDQKVLSFKANYGSFRKDLPICGPGAIITWQEEKTECGWGF